MPPSTTKGAKINARLGREYDPKQGGKLSIAQASMARRVIRGMRRGENAGSASGVVRLPGRGVTGVVCHRGHVAIQGSPTRPGVQSNVGGSSVGETICEAIYRGVFEDPGGGGPGNEPPGPFDPSDFDPFSADPVESSDPDDGSPGGESSNGDGESSDGSGDPGSEPEEPGDSNPGAEDSSDDSGDSPEEPEPDDSKSEDSDAEEPGPSNEQPPPAPDPEHDKEYLKRRLREIDNWLRSPSADTEDAVSIHPYLMGARMLREGIPVRAILHAWAINLPETAREAMGIQPYDPRDFGEREPGRHELVPYVRALVRADVPVYLKGPTQAGKSRILEQVAEDLGIPFRACPLTGGASSSWLLGSWTPNGFVTAPWPTLYGDGGVFLFDEIDAADPNMLLVVNNAVTNGHFDHPKTGERLTKHPLSRPVAAGNTWGEGTDAAYTGRQRADKATTERFRCGRVEFDHDRELQESILDAEYAAEKEWRL